MQNLSTLNSRKWQALHKRREHSYSHSWQSGRRTRNFPLTGLRRNQPNLQLSLMATCEFRQQITVQRRPRYKPYLLILPHGYSLSAKIYRQKTGKLRKKSHEAYGSPRVQERCPLKTGNKTRKH